MDKNLFFYELEGRGYTFHNKNWDEAKHGFEDDMLNMAWEMWSSGQAAKAQVVPEWISVDDRMPQYDMDVLVCFGDDNIPEIDSLISGESLDYFSNSGCDVKYWMPLPQLPEQEQSND